MSQYQMDGFFDLQPPSENPSHPQPQPPVKTGESCFYIAAKESKLVLDIEGGVVAPMTRIILWPQKEPSEAANQLWFNHYATGTIRSNADPSLVLEAVDDILYVNTFQQGNVQQLWEGFEQSICNRMTPTMVFQTCGTDWGNGVRIASSDFSLSQAFEPVFVNVAANLLPADPFVSPAPPQPGPIVTPDQGKKYFYLVCHMHGKVMDVRGANSEEGAEVIVYHKQSPAPSNQLWYWDEEGLLRSALNDFVPTASGLATVLRMYRFTGGADQRFKLHGNKILNAVGECVDVKGASRWNSTKLITYNYNGDSNQHWSCEYI